MIATEVKRSNPASIRSPAAVETMERHHDKHHQAYVDHLNKALEPYPQLADLTIEDLLRRLDQMPEAIRTFLDRVSTHADSSPISAPYGPDEARAGKSRLRIGSKSMSIARSVSITTSTKSAPAARAAASPLRTRAANRGLTRTVPGELRGPGSDSSRPGSGPTPSRGDSCRGRANRPDGWPE